MPESQLLSPIALGDLTLRNRIVISPMCQYVAVDGVAQDWHLVHLGRFAIGGAGAVFVEATGVSPEGRITHGDMGLWNDEQARALARIVDFLKANGAAAGIQLAHAGRKASTQRPWHGGGPVGEEDQRLRGEGPWETQAPSAIAFRDDWITPHAMTRVEIAELIVAWREAAKRALDAGFDMVEVHAAHGYLLNEFLSPLSNFRDDAYGGDLQGRMRFPLEVVETVRAVWPKGKPLFVRVSSIDGPEAGTQIEDTVAFARELKARGVDVVDCSSGGNAPTPPPVSGPGYQVPYAARVRAEAGIRTMAVGAIIDPRQAEAIVAEGKADLVAIARQALADPNWPVLAERTLKGDHAKFGAWAEETAFWLNLREQGLQRLGVEERER